LGFCKLTQKKSGQIRYLLINFKRTLVNLASV
jgi:hypothetical protein